MEGYWVIRTYEAGAVGEKIKYWVPGQRPTKSSRKLKSDILKVQQNEASAEKRVARLIHANFSCRDLLLGLDYDGAGYERITRGAGDEDWENQVYMAGHHQLRLWLARVRYACKAAGVPLRYIAVTSDMDGKTGAYERVHHHVIVNAEAAEIALSKWTLGGTHRENLYDVVDQTALAAYLLNQARRLPDSKKYIPSRNLVVPKPKDRIAKGGSELAVPRGGQLLHRAEWQPGRPQYIRYILPEVGKIRRAQKEGKPNNASGAPGGTRARRRQE